MRTKRMSISEFMRGKEPVPASVKLKRHFDKYGFVYKVVGTTVILFVAGGGFDYAMAAPHELKPIDLETGAENLYYKLIDVGKWVIIFKGGIETIKSAGNGDLDTAKKSFFSHLLIYLFLLGLPYGFDQVDALFAEVKGG